MTAADGLFSVGAHIPETNYNPSISPARESWRFSSGCTCSLPNTPECMTVSLLRVDLPKANVTWPGAEAVTDTFVYAVQVFEVKDISADGNELGSPRGTEHGDPISAVGPS